MYLYMIGFCVLECMKFYYRSSNKSILNSINFPVFRRFSSSFFKDLFFLNIAMYEGEYKKKKSRAAMNSCKI